MSKDTTPENTSGSKDGGVVAKLKQHKASKTGTDRTTLPETGILVTWPSFRAHAMWMKAQRLSKKNPLSVTDIYLALVCQFDGEKLTLDQFKELLPTNDVLHLVGEVMGDDEDEDAGGNALH